MTASLCVLLALAGAVFPSPARASQVGGEPPAGGTPSLPDPAGVVNAYFQLAEWVRSFDVPDPDEPAARLGIENARGACVLLRRRGRVLGAGVDTGADELMIRRAAGRAMAAVLGDRAVAALPEAMRADIGPTLTIELDVAGPMVPLPGRSYAQIAEQLEPGLDGVALRRGEDLAVLFPSQMLAANTAGSIQRLLPALATELGLPARPLTDLRRRFEVRAYRFRTTHLVQRAPGRTPFEAFRGQRLVGEEDVTEASIAAFAEALTDHLISTLWTDERPLTTEHLSGEKPANGEEPPEQAFPLGIMGDYRPVADRYEPLIAPPRDQALVAFALRRYARAPQLSADEAERARAAAWVILRELAAIAPSETDPMTDPAACAAIVLAGSDLDRSGDEADPAIGPFIAEAAARVYAAYRPDVGFVGAANPSGAAKPIDPHGQAMLAAAMARLQATSAEPSRLPVIRSAIDAAWRAVPEHQRVTLLPWIGWAEADYAQAAGAAARTDDLRALRSLLDAARIGSAAPQGRPDLAGGFALTGGRGLRADAQSTRPAAYLASMVRDPVLTGPAEAPAALGRHLKTMRFLMQLAVGDSLLWAMRNPSRALGGLRRAAWDSDQPVAAQAMALIAAAETLITLDELAGRAENRPPDNR